MIITVDITQIAVLGQKPATNVSVSGLSATSDEMPFAAALTKAIVNFAQNYNRTREKGASA